MQVSMSNWIEVVSYVCRGCRVEERKTRILEWRLKPDETSPGAPAVGPALAVLDTGIPASQALPTTFVSLQIATKSSQQPLRLSSTRSRSQEHLPVPERGCDMHKSVPYRLNKGEAGVASGEGPIRFSRPV